MNKLKLNKTTISKLDKRGMSSVNGGGGPDTIGEPIEFLSIASCRRSRSGNNCCSSGPCV